MKNYKEGSIIVYRPFGGGRRTVLVECKESNIKNGRPGFDGVLCDREGKPIHDEHEGGVWGYDDQIISVLRS